MSKVKFVLNHAGVAEILKGAGIQAALSKVGTQIANSAGKGYGTKTAIRPTRAVTTVYPATVAAHFDNLKKNTLLKAMGSGGTND
ncbi:hypothetical protein ABVC40_06195 [Lactobacillus iners]|uniref:hypothetical protein n=1 Tax=Lactobacillus iners TaxID=147802 RepID=UPI001F08D433|nr:hypothetical protein [Lactobacillus iners]